MKITELAYVHGLLDSAINILNLVKENIDGCELNEEEKAEFQSYMDESLCEFISEEEEKEECECDCEEGCECNCDGCTRDSCCEKYFYESEKDKIIKHLSKTIVMLTEQSNAE